jgi:hypothetical protein
MIWFVGLFLYFRLLMVILLTFAETHVAPKLPHQKLLLVLGIRTCAGRDCNHSTFEVALAIALYSSYVCFQPLHLRR